MSNLVSLNKHTKVLFNEQNDIEIVHFGRQVQICFTYNEGVVVKQTVKVEGKVKSFSNFLYNDDGRMSQIVSNRQNINIEYDDERGNVHIIREKTGRMIIPITSFDQKPSLHNLFIQY